MHHWLHALLLTHENTCFEVAPFSVTAGVVLDVDDLFCLEFDRKTPGQLEALSAVVKEALEVRMELVAMGLELLEKMARSPRVVARLPAVS